jgi:hypothetical protein
VRALKSVVAMRHQARDLGRLVVGQAEPVADLLQPVALLG